MMTVNLEVKIQNFFDSVITVLETSKLYVFDGTENKIQQNINIVKSMKQPYYFKETPFMVLGHGITPNGFKQFDKGVTKLIDIFYNVLTKIYSYRNDQNSENGYAMLEAIKTWEKVKPNTFISGLMPKILIKKQYQNTY
ncbi:MAG TPA: hypothetical protein PKJ33_03145 [Alphaproteobacteria bacterium]|nr:hypothetical protein [Alphaproteobacteria bacterium]